MDFKRKWSNNGKLDFINDDGVAPPLLIDITANQHVYSPHGDALLSVILVGSGESLVSTPLTAVVIDSIAGFNANNQFDKPLSAHEIGFDINVNRDTNATVGSVTYPANMLQQSQVSLFSDSPFLSAGKVALSQTGKALQNNLVTYQGLLPKQAVNNVVLLRDGDKAHNSVLHINRLLADTDVGIDVVFEDGADITNGLVTKYKYPPRTDCEKSSYWQETNAMRHHVSSDFTSGVPLVTDWASKFEDAIPPIGNRPIVLPPIITPPDLSPIPLDFKTLWDNSGELDFFSIELDALIVMNSFSVHHITPDNVRTEIMPYGTSIAFDIHAKAIVFTGTLDGEDNLLYLRQDIAGAPRIEINVNGHMLNLRVRDYKRTRTIEGNSYSFTAVSSTQFLYSPWSHKTSVNNSTITSAFQLVQSQMPDFTLYRDITPDWVLPANCYSANQVAPIDVLNAVLNACGGIAQAHLTEDAINIQPRYKVSPSSWQGLTDEQCDHVIPDHAIVLESGENKQSPEINSILVSGEDYGHINLITKEGTAGDASAADITSQLTIDPTVNLELARNVFADSGDQEVVSLSLPLLPPGSDFSLCLPGDVLRVKYDSGEIKTGICLSNNLAVNDVDDIWQSVKWELNHAYS